MAGEINKFLLKFKKVSSEKLEEIRNLASGFDAAEEEPQVAPEIGKSDDEKIQELKNTFQLQERKLNALAKDRATLANMLELQKSTLTNLIEEKTQEVAELEEKLKEARSIFKYPTGSINKIELKYEPTEIAESVNEIVPKIKELSELHGVAFTLEIDEMQNPIVLTDAKYLNNIILEMFDDAFKSCDKKGKVIYYIRQKSEPVEGYAYYEYSCIYLGDSLAFDSELANALDGRVSIERSNGGNILTIRFKFKVAEEEKKYVWD